MNEELTEGADSEGLLDSTEGLPDSSELE